MVRKVQIPIMLVGKKKDLHMESMSDQWQRESFGRILEHSFFGIFCWWNQTDCRQCLQKDNSGGGKDRLGGFTRQVIWHLVMWQRSLRTLGYVLPEDAAPCPWKKLCFFSSAPKRCHRGRVPAFQMLFNSDSAQMTSLPFSDFKQSFFKFVYCVS